MVLDFSNREIGIFRVYKQKLQSKNLKKLGEAPNMFGYQPCEFEIFWTGPSGRSRAFIKNYVRAPTVVGVRYIRNMTVNSNS